MAGMIILQNSFRRVCVAGKILVPICASVDWNVTCNFKMWNRVSPQYILEDSSTEVVTGGYPFSTGCKIVRNGTANTANFVYDSIGGYYHDCQARVCFTYIREVVVTFKIVDLTAILVSGWEVCGGRESELRFREL